MMDQELQWLIKNLYGDRQLTDLQLSNIIKSWESNHMGYRDNMKNAVLNKIKLGLVNLSNSTLSNKSNKPNSTAFLRPTASQTQLVSAKQQIPTLPNLTKPSNDMSAIADFKQAFRQARQGGHKTFFWKKTKANPSGMFSTEVASKQSETEKSALKPKGKNSRASTPASKGQPLTKTEYAFDGRSNIDISQFPWVYPREDNEPKNPDDFYPEFGLDAVLHKSDLDSMIPILYPYEEKILLDNGNVKTYKDGTIKDRLDLSVNVEVPEITGKVGTEWGKAYAERMKAEDYFRRKGAGMFSSGGNISQQSTPLIGNSGASIADVITVINSKDMNAIQELFSSIGLEGFEQAIRGILQMAEAGDGSAMQALQTLLELMLESQKAKLGAKLNYIQKLKGICPEGTEKIYLKNGGCMCALKAKDGTKTLIKLNKTKMPTEYDEKKHERLAIGEAMGKNNKAQQDSLQTYRKLYNDKSASDKYKMGDQDPHGKNPKKKVLEKSCGGKTLVNRKKKK